MAAKFQAGDCVRVPDGRIGRVRARAGRQLRIRVRRRTSETHQFLLLAPSALRRVECPKGCMSPAGYRRYLRPTLAKLRARVRTRRARRARRVRAPPLSNPLMQPTNAGDAERRPRPGLLPRLRSIGFHRVVCS